jgi:uracil-DNA glycosylase
VTMESKREDQEPAHYRSGSTPDSEDTALERRRLVRELRQRLESLARAGLTSLPRSTKINRIMALAPTETSAEEVVENSGDVADQARAESPIPGEPRARPAEPDVPSSPPARSVAVRTSPPRGLAPGPPTSAYSLFDEPGFENEVIPPDARPGMLQVLASEVAECRRCRELAETRTQTVFADGSPTARLMFIGEAPGAEEDRQGLPFVGRAGQLLTDMITKGMGLRREDVYIANILKCRPPENRDPSPEESSNCLHYLERQIEIVRPEFLCLLGRIAVQTLLETTLSMSRLRGKWYRYRGIPTVVTYHPAYLLRNPASKKEAWVDLQTIMNAMGLPIPSRKKPQD